MNNCIFCQIASGTLPAAKVYENDQVFAFLDIQPASPYHTLVIPKKHYETIFDTPQSELVELIKVIKLLANRYQEKLGIENVEIVNNSGKDAGQEVFHLHFHIVPRSTSDGLDRRRVTKPELTQKFSEMLEKLSDEL